MADNLYCPHCGYFDKQIEFEKGADDEGLGVLGADDGGSDDFSVYEFNCPSCNKSFYLQ